MKKNLLFFFLGIFICFRTIKVYRKEKLSMISSTKGTTNELESFSKMDYWFLFKSFSLISSFYFFFFFSN